MKQNITKPPGLTQLITRKELAQRWNVCTHTVQRYQCQGRLRAVLFNARLIRYRLEDVEAFEADGLI